MEPLFDVIPVEGGRIIKAWKRGVVFEEKAVEQLKQTARLPFIYKHVAAMPDTHWGIGATIGSVIATKGAVVPAAVGVDIGCGMCAVRLTTSRSVFTDLPAVRAAIEKAVPAGRTDNGGRNDRGAWGLPPEWAKSMWEGGFAATYDVLCSSHPDMRAQNTGRHLGTLGTGNHFLELSVDEFDRVWLVLHSGSRGMGNRIGTYFTQLAKKQCARWFVSLPDPDLAYLVQDTTEYVDYLDALQLAQRFAWVSREAMVVNTLQALASLLDGEVLETERVHCHHNYATWERHFGEEVLVTRKGAVRAQEGDLGIIPGSMGAKSYIVRGLGSAHSFCSCSHGAGRVMGRQQAKRQFSVEEHAAATVGVECDKSAGTLDETPAAYKSIDAVMAAQQDLVEPVHTLKQFLCVKGIGERG